LEQSHHSFEQIHPHDTLSLSFKGLNDTFLIKLSPNMDLVHPDIHSEVAEKKLEQTHDKHILSKVRAYKGFVYRAKQADSDHHIRRFHKLSAVLESIPEFEMAGEARLVVLSSGSHKPKWNTQNPSTDNLEHYYHNLEFEGSFSLNEHDYAVRTVPQYLMHETRKEKGVGKTPLEKRAPHHQESTLVITRTSDASETQNANECAFSTNVALTDTSMSFLNRDYHLFKRQQPTAQPGSGEGGCKIGKTATVVSILYLLHFQKAVY
jgi:hypothetical protein